VWSENFGAQRFYARYGFEKAGEYLFPVGDTHDLEFILRRAPRAPDVHCRLLRARVQSPYVPAPLTARLFA
jgi:ribosomal protein S18 acetylase RimI-like enzyme